VIFDGNGAQLKLPDMLWPAGVDLPDEPLYFGSMPLADANALLERWKHPLGQYRRPFGYQAWRLAVEGRAAAVVVSGSTVSKRVEGDLHRRNTVERGRIARGGQPTCTRSRESERGALERVRVGARGSDGGSRPTASGAMSSVIRPCWRRGCRSADPARW
jgi:hypothetical protein